MNIDTQENIEWSPSEMLEVQLSEPDDFLKIKETLTRIGVSSKKDYNTLYQSCHILHKQGRYFIVHFKELFMLDGKPSTFTTDDRNRRNTIAILLSDWGLLTLVKKAEPTDTTNLKMIKIISHRDKADWTLISKYSIGNVKKS
jgi:hypothetical protein